MNLLPALDQRLQGAFDFYPLCKTGADIGCDHGYLPLHLLVDNRCENMILTDISAPALKKGLQLMEKHQLTARSRCLLGDGLAPLDQKVDAISILGMGGNTICQILKSNPEKLQNAALILSAHTQADKIRELLPSLHYKITKEQVVKAAGRFYVLIKAEPGKADYTQKELLLGPLLLKIKDSHTLAYWRWQHQVFTKALKGLTQGAAPINEEGLFMKTYIAYLEEEL